MLNRNMKLTNFIINSNLRTAELRGIFFINNPSLTTNTLAYAASIKLVKGNILEREKLLDKHKKGAIEDLVTSVSRQLHLQNNSFIK